jgi:putative transposase
MYRILDANKEVRERRNQLRHPTHAKPQLVANAPNQVWSWDITKLLGPKKWTYYPLYVVIDIYSRYVVGWMPAHRECQYLAERLLRETAIKEQIRPDQLTIHADRGAAMTSRPVSQLMASLGVSRSHSRPHTSNDNPYSESQFKTNKSHPDFPDRFESYDRALDCSHRLIDWYNHHHRHWNLGLLTPAAVHTGAAGRILDQRRVILEKAYAWHPERFVRGIPRPSRPAAEVWINPPENVAIRRAIQIPSDTDFVTQVSQSH